MFSKLMKTYKNERLCLDVIKKLAQTGLIDDVRYAEKLVMKLVGTKKYGYRRAKREMLMKGLKEDTIEDALEVFGDVYGKNLTELLRSKYSRLLTDSGDRKSIEKVKSALVRYGYGFDEINRAVKQYFEDAEYAEE